MESFLQYNRAKSSFVQKTTSKKLKISQGNLILISVVLSRIFMDNVVFDGSLKFRESSQIVGALR